MVHFVDTDFNKDFTSHYSLLFQLEEHQYTYAVYDKRSGKLQLLKTVAFNSAFAPEAFSKFKVSVTAEDALQAMYKEVKIGVVDSAFTLLPRTIFEEEKAKAYLSLTSPIDDQSTVLVNQVRGIFVRNVFSLPLAISSYLDEVFTHPKWFHASTALMETAIRNRDQFADQQIILDIKPGVMYLMYYAKKEFVFMNQFKYVNKDDFLYYVLLMADQFEIDREHCDLKLSGEILPDSMLYNELWKFFSNISFLQPNEHIILPDALREKPVHMFNSLFSLDLCE